jgi:hypothetical protein
VSDELGAFPVFADGSPLPSCRRTVFVGCTIFDEEDAA